MCPICDQLKLYTLLRYYCCGHKGICSIIGLLRITCCLSGIWLLRWVASRKGTSWSSVSWGVWRRQWPMATNSSRVSRAWGEDASSWGTGGRQGPTRHLWVEWALGLLYSCLADNVHSRCGRHIGYLGMGGRVPLTLLRPIANAKTKAYAACNEDAHSSTCSSPNWSCHFYKVDRKRGQKEDKHAWLCDEHQWVDYCITVQAYNVDWEHFW